MSNKKSIFASLTVLLLCHTHITAQAESCAIESIEEYESEHAQAVYAIDTLASKDPQSSTDTTASCIICKTKCCSSQKRNVMRGKTKCKNEM